MTFINPAILPALTAAALPVLIHLFSRQRRKEVDFSTLRFLKKLEKKRMRRVRLTEWILLALRTLAVFFIIFAFTRPAVENSSGLIEGQSRTSAVLLIDNSIASQIQTARGTVLSEQISRTLETLPLFSENDEIIIVAAGEKAERLTPRTLPGGDERLRKKVFEVLSSDAAADWEGALEHVSSFFEKSENPNREVFIFSSLLSRPDILDSLLSANSTSFRAYLIPARPGSLINLTLNSLKRETEILLKGKTVEFSALIYNHAETGIDEVPVSLYVQGDRTATVNLTVPAQASTPVKMKFVPGSSGYLTGKIKAGYDDLLPADNQACFTLYVPERMAAAVIGDSAEVKRIVTALNPGGTGEYSIGITLLNTPLEINDLSANTALIIAGYEGISPFFTDAVKRHLDRGGGVMIFPSLEIDPARFNRQFSQPLGLSPLGELGRSEDGVQWARIDYSHPIFEGVFESDAELESPLFKRFFTFAGEKGAEIIGLSRGGAFLKKFTRGPGTVLMFAAGTGSEWGDFARRGIFAPVLHRSVTYLASGKSGRDRSFTAGKPIEYLTDSDVFRLEMQRPDGGIVELTAGNGDQTRNVVYRETGKAGIYNLTSRSDTLQMFAVNPALIENFGAQIPKVDHGGVFNAADGADLAGFVQAGRLGKELWKIFLAAGLFCLLVEMLIIKISK